MMSLDLKSLDRVVINVGSKVFVFEKMLVYGKGNICNLLFAHAKQTLR